ncbi:phage baseplate plug family protein [Chitiniphilus shinanonensis]|uniref:phage baseplate plug family protein n=1 Tax=Chitiniphilus shinanonensis TaxID=553088 RepID=UPI003071F528
MFKIPIDSSPYQEQSFDFAGHSLRLTVRYNSLGDHWGSDVYDLGDQVWLAQGVALAVGVPIDCEGYR